jgi:membrane glycosyltransferase
VPDIVVRRWLFLGLVVSSTIVADQPVWSVIRVDGLSPLEILVFALFTILFAWIAASFWLACIGAYVRWKNIDVLPAASGPANHYPAHRVSRTAIVMPVYNESALRTFAGLAVVRESVRAAGGAAGFDYFILSDTTEPTLQMVEEQEWRRLHDTEPEGHNIFYRHRPRNIGRKSGNIQDFCENWGALYDYMVVLDADSLMTGETLVRLVALMDGNPRAALIQVPPQLIGRESLFARIQQFSSSIYGPCHAAGLAFLQGTDGNYWGHNAIIRVRAFMRHCGLPRLPGEAPLGGEILSHDFVEAALLRRAGWDVLMAPTLGGSFEEPPPTIFDYLKRDRRWCQGNMQHARLVLAVGLRMPSRLHFVMGVMNYLASPLWLLLLISSAIEMYLSAQVIPVTYFGRYPVLSAPISHTVELVILLASTVALLYAPKILALLIASRDPLMRAAHGGRLRLFRSVVLECVFSTLLAPVVMLSHSWFVLSILCGRTTGWGAQQRDDRALPLWFVMRMFAPHTLIGIAATFAVYHYLPGEFWWFLPFLVGMSLAIPLVYFSSSLRLGNFARRLGFFQTPDEIGGMNILKRLRAIMSKRTNLPRLSTETAA